MLAALLLPRRLDRIADRTVRLIVVEHVPDSTIEATFKRRVDGAEGRYALIEKSSEFTLVPWRAMLETSSGILRCRGSVEGQCFAPGKPLRNGLTGNVIENPFEKVN